MATLRDLVQMSLEELWQAHLGNRISDQIRNHTNQNTIRPLSHIGFYTDCGNYAGSLVMLVLLFPQDFLHQGQSTFSALPLVNGAGDRADVLRFEGKWSQRSGIGQNNYRTNLLEAILGVLGDEAQYTQVLWECVCICCL